MSAKKRKINLLVKEGFENTTFGRVLTWSLSAGRIIVVVTELVVIIAFLSRFWLDRTLTDLNESNGAKRKQIEASKNFETDFRAAQTRLSAYKKLAVKTNASAKLGEVAASLPADVTLNRVTVSKKELMVVGTALSESGLAGVMKSLSASSSFTNITLTNLVLSTEGQQGLVFTIKGNVTSDVNTAKQ